LARLYPQELGSLFVASYDSHGYGGGIRPHLHTGVLSLIKFSQALQAYMDWVQNSLQISSFISFVYSSQLKGIYWPFPSNGRLFWLHSHDTNVCTCPTESERKRNGDSFNCYYYSQNYWVFGLLPSSGILENRKHDVSETGSVSALR
jgi:hypothetical protein